MTEPRTFPVTLIQPDGTAGAGAYESPAGDLPSVGDEIAVDEHGGRARVLEVTPDDPAPIRAALIE
jgi:hypothetical protein